MELAGKEGGLFACVDVGLGGPFWVWLLDPSEVVVGKGGDCLVQLLEWGVSYGEVGDVSWGEEGRGEDEEGDCVEGRFLCEGVVEIWHAERSSLEGLCAWDCGFLVGLGGVGNRLMMGE